jgi:hypothetical protein
MIAQFRALLPEQIRLIPGETLPPEKYRRVMLPGAQLTMTIPVI